MKSRSGKAMTSGGEEGLTCEEVITSLHELIAAELTPAEAGDLRRHLAICPSCVAYLESYECAVTLAREALREETESEPRALTAEMIRAILATRA